MSKDVIFSFIRTALTAIGAFLVGKTVLGTTVTGDVWQGWVGGAIALASTVWGVLDKSATIDAIQSGIRSFVVALGGILIAMGKLKSETLASILGVITPIIAFIYSILSKQKTSQIASGELTALPNGKTAGK